MHGIGQDNELRSNYSGTILSYLCLHISVENANAQSSMEVPCFCRVNSTYLTPGRLCGENVGEQERCY